MSFKSGWDGLLNRFSSLRDPVLQILKGKLTS